MGLSPVHFFGQKARARRPCHPFFKRRDLRISDLRFAGDDLEVSGAGGGGGVFGEF